MKAELRGQTEIIFHRYLFDSDYRVSSRDALDCHAKYEKKIPHAILLKCPNYQSRLKESEGRNATQIALRSERVRMEEEQNKIPEQEAEDRKTKEVEAETKRKAAEEAEKKS